MARARAVLVLAVLVSVGLGVFVFLRERDQEVASSDDASLGDASLDGRATAAKGKAVTKKKNKTPRTGKTRVTRAPTKQASTAAPIDDGRTRENVDPPADDEGQPAQPMPPRPHRHYTATGPSYDSALAGNNQQIAIGAKDGPDLTDAQLSAPMSDASFIDECDAPDDMEVTVKVAIKMGRAVGVTVRTQPPSADVAGCIDHHVRGLSWPSSPKMDSFITTY